MKALILHRKQTRTIQDIKQFADDLRRRYPSLEVHLQDADTRQGVHSAKSHAVVDFPAVVLHGDMIGHIHMWQGELPPAAALAAYVK